MTIANMFALFGAMVVLAAVPSVSVLAVSARSAASGFAHGAAMAMGIVTGDLLFIALAMFGLAVLVDAMGSLFVLVKYLGGAYLIWLGFSLWRSGPGAAGGGETVTTSHPSSFMAGVLITLGDQKAVLFYLGFLPAFIDLSALSLSDAGLVMVIAVVAVGGVKLAYAYAAHSAGAWGGSKLGKMMNLLAAGMMTITGVFIVLAA